MLSAIRFPREDSPAKLLRTVIHFNLLAKLFAAPLTLAQILVEML